MIVLPLGLSLITGMVITPHVSRAQRAAAAETGATLLKKAMSLEAAGKLGEAADAYTRAAAAFERENNSDANIKALNKSALLNEKYADQLLNGTVAAQQKTPAVNKAATAQKAAPAALQAGDVAPQPLEASSIVKTRGGYTSVSGPGGKPIEGLMLSRHNFDIHNPGIVVTPDGTIHVAFVEEHAVIYSYSVYHRSSSDGGKSWSDAKNLSEVLPDYQIGNCRIAADGAGRVYVIWRTGAEARAPTSGIDPHADRVANNLVYRVLEGGAWNGKAVQIHEQATHEFQNEGSASWFVSTDPAGKVHVIWNQLPLAAHKKTIQGPGTGPSEIMETVLNGKDPGQPHQIYQAKISDLGMGYGLGSDYFDTLEGYVDGAGQSHILVKVLNVLRRDTTNKFHLIENGMETPAIELPGRTFDTWVDPPRLLLDAQGRRHVIAWYKTGEQPHIRDYVLGSEAEPAIIRSAKEVKGNIIGFQAYQGPAGRMVVTMQMNDTGKDTDGELYVSTSDGGKWSAPVNVTNNTGRFKFASTNTSTRSNISTLSYWHPGTAAAAFDRQGHLVLAYISKKHSSFNSSAVGITLASGSTSKPQLLFLRF